ncbi:MAG: class I SAM-dependent methyltransferase [Saprospiraceae bacterium]|nr:class I SAM-dependent methyltransferase [Saprospiraceae bacterium]
MVFGDYFRFATKHIGVSPKSILEVGSGLGHMALELARNGHFVTGIELSSESVKVAETFASKNTHKANFGSLNYINSDFFKLAIRKSI